MSSIWSTASQPPGASTTSPTPLQDDDDDFVYDFATIGGSPSSQQDPDTSGESFHYIPSATRSGGKESETVARDKSGGGRGASLMEGQRGDKEAKGLGIMLPMSPRGDQGDVAHDPSMVYATAPHPPRPPLSIAEPSPPSLPSACAAPPSKPAAKPLYSRWADPNYVPEPPSAPMKLLKSPALSSASKPPPLDASAPPFAPPLRSAPAPIPIRPPQTSTELSLAEKFRARIPPGVASSMPSFHAPTPPPPPSPATTRSTTPGESEVDRSEGKLSKESDELGKAREALAQAEQKVVKLEKENKDLLAQLKEAAEVAMKEGDQANAENRGLEELVISLRERCAELEASESALEEERDGLKARLEEAVQEIVSIEDNPTVVEMMRGEQEDLNRRLADTKQQLRTAVEESKRTMELCTRLQDELNATRAHQQVFATRTMEAKEDGRKKVAQAKEERDVAIARVKELEGEATKEALLMAELGKRLEDEQIGRAVEKGELMRELEELRREKDELAAELVAATSRRSNTNTNIDSKHRRHYSVQELMDLAKSPLTNVAPDLSNAPPAMVTPSPQSNASSNGARSSSPSTPRSHHSLPARPPNSPNKPDRDAQRISSLRREIDSLKLASTKLQTEKEAAEFDWRKENEKRRELDARSKELEMRVQEQGLWMEEVLKAVQGLEVENGELKARLEGGGVKAPRLAPPAPAPRSPPSDDSHSHSSGFVTPSGTPPYSAPLSPQLWPTTTSPPSNTHPEAPPPPLSSVLARDPTPPLSMHDPLRPGSVPVVQVGELVEVGVGEGSAERGGGRGRRGELNESERAFGEKGGMAAKSGAERELEKIEKEFAADAGYQGGEGGGHGREWSTTTAGSAVDSMKGFSDPGDIDEVMRREEEGRGSSTLLDSFHSAASGSDYNPTLPPLPASAPLWDPPHLPSSSSSAASRAPSMTSPTSPRFGSASSTGSRTSAGHHSARGSASGGWIKGRSVGGKQEDTEEEEL